MIENCNLCGICLAKDSLYKITQRETVSALGKILLLKQGVMDKIFYADHLSGELKSICPNKIDLTEEIIKMREKLVENGIETAANKMMIENLQKFGNPFGDPKQKPKEIFWC